MEADVHEHESTPKRLASLRAMSAKTVWRYSIAPPGFLRYKVYLSPADKYHRLRYTTKQTWTAYEASRLLPTRNSTGTALSCAMTENAISAGTDTSYNTPISVLPANHSRPYPLLNTP